MGVDYSAVSGFGFLLTTDEIETLAEKTDYVTKYPEDGFDDYEFVEWLCKHYGVNYAVAGSEYDGDTSFIIGTARSVSLYGFEEVAIEETVVPDDLVSKLNEILLVLGIVRKVSFYSGLYIH